MTGHTSDGAGDDGNGADGPPDRARLVRVLGAIAEPHRRAILATLAERPAPCPFEELAAGVARRTERDADRVLIRMYHHEVPMLARHGLVDVDWRNREVAPTQLARALGERIVESEAHDDEG